MFSALFQRALEDILGNLSIDTTVLNIFSPSPKK
jgi:hypothetical protein